MSATSSSTVMGRRIGAPRASTPPRAPAPAPRTACGSALAFATGTSVTGQQGGLFKAAKRAFGGTGFTLQRLSGSGRAYVELHGDVVEFDLAAGEKLRTHPGHVGLFDASVTLNLTTIPGIKNKFFGGEGLFLTELVGPGKVWLQSITLAPYLVTDKEVGEGSALATGAAILGGLLKK